MLEPNLALRPLASEALIHPWFKDQNEPVMESMRINRFFAAEKRIVMASGYSMISPSFR